MLTITEYEGYRPVLAGSGWAISLFLLDSSDLTALQSRLRAAFFICIRRNRVKVISG
jgi:hypothetical protein